VRGIGLLSSVETNIKKTHLQKVGGNTDETGESTSGEGGAASTGVDWWWDGAGGVLWWDDDWDLDGGVGVDRSRAVSWAASGADGLSNGGVGLGASARAVGDGQSGGLGDGVSLVVLNNGGWQRAVGGVGSDDLNGGEGGSLVATRKSGSGEGSGSEDSGELHFDCWFGGIEKNRIMFLFRGYIRQVVRDASKE